jgi:hypothetical protein
MSKVREANTITSPLIPIKGVRAIDIARVSAGKVIQGDVGAIKF